MNNLVLIGTGFVLARVIYVWYVMPAKSLAKARAVRSDDRR